MAWIKLDDNWMEHPKVVRAGRDARDLWLASITWCARYSTDGYFPSEILTRLAISADVDVANVQQIATRLLDVRLWDATDTGYHVHDFLEYNPSYEQVLATRAARREAGSAGGQAKASKMPSKMLANGVAKSWQNSAPTRTPTPTPINTNGDAEFEKLQHMLEQATGRLATPADEAAITRLVGAGVIEEDIRSAIAWRMSEKLRPVATIAQLEQGILHSRADRVQQAAAAGVQVKKYRKNAASSEMSEEERNRYYQAINDERDRIEAEVEAEMARLDAAEKQAEEGEG